MPPKRKRQSEEEAGAPAWMATFSDLATLLLAFFVLLYSFSILDIKKFETFVASFSGVGLLESGTTPIKKTPSDQQSDSSSDNKSEDLESQSDEESGELDPNLVEVYTVIKGYLKENDLQTDVALSYETRGIILEIKDKIFFDSGKSEIKAESRAFLNHLAGLFKEIPNQISIEGHTDNVPTKPENHATNWELSVDRAAKVVRYFTESMGLQPKRFAAVGYGEWRPLKKNNSNHNRSLNRRVTIVVLAKDQYESRVLLDGGKE